MQAIVHTLVVTINTNGPIYRIGTNIEHLFQLVHQIKRVAAVTVQLVDKGKDGQMAAVANPKQLFSLRLHALGCVDKHNSAVCSHQGTIGILRKVLVTRGIEDINAVTIVIKLQHGASYRNTTLLFDFHPVRNRMLSGFSSLYRTSQMNCSAVKQKLFS